MEWLNWLIGNYGTISIAIVTIIGLLAKTRRYINHAIRSIILGVRFHDVFGDNPAGSIKALHDAIQSSHDTLEVRVKIAERVLKIGIYICGLDGKCIWTNEHLNEMFGLDSTEMAGLGWLQAIIPEDRKRVHEEWMYSVKEGLEYNCRYTIYNKRSGKYTKVFTSAIAVLNDSDQKQCYVGYLKIEQESTNEDYP